MLSLAIFRESESEVDAPWVCASKLSAHAVPSPHFHGMRTYRTYRVWPPRTDNIGGRALARFRRDEKRRQMARARGGES